jgi:ankyrin repeat protein
MGIQQAFFQACREGDLDKVNHLIRRHYHPKKWFRSVRQFIGYEIDLNAMDELGYTPLMLAAKAGYANVVNALIAAGADIRIIHPRGRNHTALRFAIDNHHFSIAKTLMAAGAVLSQENQTTLNAYLFTAGNTAALLELISLGANINGVNEKGDSVLMHHLGQGIDLHTLLALPGLQINQTNQHGHSALTKAIEHGNIQMMETLIAAGATLNAQAQFLLDQALLSAVKTWNLSNIQKLMKLGAKINAETQTTLDQRLVDNAKLGEAAILELINVGSNINGLNKNGDSVLMRIIEQGTDLPTLKTLLAIPGLQINQANKLNHTALSMAIEHGTLEMVNVLIAAGATSNVWTDYALEKALVRSMHSESLTDYQALIKLGATGGVCELINAIRNDREDVMRLLALDPNLAKQSANNGYTGLITASGCNKVNILKALIQAGANVNAQDNLGTTALIAAVENGASKELIDTLLLVPDIDVNLKNSDYRGNYTALLTAVQQWRFEHVLSILSSPNVRIDQAGTLDGITPIMLACQLGSIKIVTALLKKNANLNLLSTGGMSALAIATAKNHTEIVTLLLESGAQPINTLNPLEGNWALIAAIKSSNLEVFNKLLGIQAVRDQINCAPTHGSVYLYSHSGETALACAAQNENTDILTALLAVPGINVNITNAKGLTALMHAIRNKNPNAITSLLAVPGINVNLANAEGMSALMLAIRHHDTNAITPLLAVPGINVNLANAEGMSALMLAIRHHDTNAITPLLAVPGINVNLARPDGETAISLAFESGYHNIVTLLQARGAVLPERLRPENRARNRINGNQSVHEVSVHESVSKSAKNLRELYKFTQEQINEQTIELFTWLNADFSDTSALPCEYKSEWLAPARTCVTRLKAFGLFTDQRSGVTMQQALAFVWAGINNEYARGTDKTALSREEITSRRINFLKNLYEIQREYNLADGATPQDNGDEDHETCVSGSFNKLIAALNEVGHVGVDVLFITSTILAVQVPFLTTQAFGTLLEEDRKRFAQSWKGENEDVIQAECFEVLKKLVANQLHQQYDAFHQEVPKLNEMIAEAIENVQWTEMSAVVEKEKQAILQKEQAAQAEREHQAAMVNAALPAPAPTLQPQPVVFSCNSRPNTRSAAQQARDAERVAPEPLVAAAAAQPADEASATSASRYPKRARPSRGFYKE